MKRFYWIFILPAFLVVHSSWGQSPRYFEHWELNWGVALTFSSGQPVQVSTNTAFDDFFQIAVSDPLTGDLLFVTDRDGVRDRFGALMPNGGGFQINTIMAMIPHPGDPDIFYLFNVMDQGGLNEQPWGYSVVDMSLNNGLGDVTADKMISFTEPSLLAVAAVSNIGGTQYGFITHPTTGGDFHIYPVTVADGLVTTPVVQSIGPVTALHPAFITSLALPPANDRLAFVWGEDEGNGMLGNRIWTFDLDPMSMTLGNSMVFDAAVGSSHRTIAFSPDGSRLYADQRSMTSGQPDLFQYDLSLGTAQAISASAFGLHVTGPDTSTVLDLRLMPDSMVYGVGNADPWRSKLVRVMAPNGLGAACALDSVGLETGATLNGPLDLSWSFWVPAGPSGIAAVDPATTAFDVQCIDATSVLLSLAQGHAQRTGTLVLYGQTGAELATALWPRGAAKLELQVGPLASGIYIGVLSFAEGKTFTAKFVVP